MNTGERITKLREEKGWNQRELARRVNLNFSVMNRIESGERPIKDQELDKIATVLDVTTDFILGRSQNRNMTEEEEFHKFANDPDLQQWYYKELPESDEDKLRQLRKMWEIMKDSK